MRFLLLLLVYLSSVSQTANARSVRKYIHEVSTEETGKSLSLTEKILNDPEDCIHQCWHKEKTTAQNIAQANADKMALVILNSFAKPLETVQSNLTLNISLEEVTEENMGSLFRDLCTTAREADGCLAGCPKSQLSIVASTIHYNSNTNLFCEAEKNWKTFSECDEALRCINQTLDRTPCEAECGPNIDPLDMFRLKYLTSLSSFVVQHDPDAISLIEPFCKDISCYLDCNKAAMVRQCGIKAYGLYLRMKKGDTKTLLTVLDELDEGDVQMINCKRFLKF